MNPKKIQKFVLSYLEATDCHLIEKSPGHVTVKLSPTADRALTNRPYYWSFIDNTGTPPETMSYSWMFDKSPLPASGVPATPLSSVMTPGGRVIREEVYFGSRRLDHLFHAVRGSGRCVMMFEEPPRERRGPLESIPYAAWLGVNFKVAYECDTKRECLYGWGISLATGMIDDRFWERIRTAKLTPCLPANVHLLRNGLTVRKGMSQLETSLERRLKTEDFTWAEEAEARRRDELRRIEQYYGPQLERASSADQADLLAELQSRKQQREREIDWQYRPRIHVSVLNCGIFHLAGIR